MQKGADRQTNREGTGRGRVRERERETVSQSVRRFVVWFCCGAGVSLGCIRVRQHCVATYRREVCNMHCGFQTTHNSNPDIRSQMLT